MALNPVKIFYSDGKILFEADKRTIEPKFTGTLVASLVETSRVKIERTDRQRPDGSNRVVFRRMKAARVRNSAGESLVDTLGLTAQQVVDYLNVEFNRSSVDELNQSTFVEYDIYANVEYAGLFGASDGSALRPYATIQVAVDAADDGDNIFLKGDFQLTAEVLLPADKSLHFFGRDTTQWCYASYDATNGKLVHQSSSTSTAKYSFHGIRFINAGDYAVNIRSATEITIQDCEFLRNGWSGNGLSCTDSATASTLGFDSPQADLQAFGAGSETSDGGAMSIRSTPVVNVTDNTIHSNRRGLRIQDCGIGGAGIIARNRTYNNIESGIYLAAGSDGATATSGDGCENFTVYNNFCSNNSSSGILVVGGSNNIISLNRVEGNWNAGVMLKNVSDTRARDMDLDNNNRSEFNGIGNVGDAKASIQIDGQYMRSDATFLAEVLDTTVHNTGLGSSTTTNGLLIGSDVGTISGAVVNIDDVGFVSQDYAINLSEVDVSNITLSLGDCRYQGIAQAAVLAPIAGNYNELPFSNHVTSVLQVDVVVDTLRQMISLTEGVGGNVINTYKMNELQSVINGSAVDLIQKQTDKIQLRGCTLNNTFVGGVVAGNTVTSMSNALNAAFGMDLTQYKEYLVSTVGINGDDSTLPAQADNWYIAYGSRAAEQVTAAGVIADLEDQQPFYNGDFLEKGHEYTWTHNNNGNYMIGVWSGATVTHDETDVLSTSNWTPGFRFVRSANRFSGSASTGVDIATRHTAGDSPNVVADGQYSVVNGVTTLALRYGNDNYLYLIDITDGGAYVIGRSNTPLVGDTVTVFWGGENQPNAIFPVMQERTERWTMVHDLDSSEGSEWADGIEDKTVLRSNMEVSPGQKVTLNFNYFGRNEKFGLGYTGASSGESNAEDLITSQLFYNSAEVLKGIESDGDWTWNLDATYSYDPNGDQSDVGYWNNNGVGNLGNISIRYLSDNSVELWHETNNERIASLTVDLDGTPFNVYFGADEDMPVDRIPNPQLFSLTTAEENPDTPQVWYYIESPDGTFTYPLFAGSNEANSVDTAQGGAGSSNGYSFPDEPTSTTWYGPVTDITTNGTVAPSHGTWGTFTNIIWNEIVTDADSTAVPASFSAGSVQIDEAAALNFGIHPAGATFTTTIQSAPAWITQATNNANVVGTAPVVAGDNVNFPSETYTLTVVRTNTYGSSTGTLTIVVNNLTAPASLPGTLHAGSVIASSATYSSGKIYLQVTGGHLVYDIDTLEDGDKIEWYHQDGTYGFGIAASGVDKTTDLMSYAVDNSALWDLLAPITGSPTHTNGQNFGEGFAGSQPGLVPLGWDDNTNPQVIPTRPIYAASDVWKLYNNAGTIELSLNGTLFRSSSSTHTDPVITFAMNQEAGDGGVVEFTEFPTFTHTANTASAPSGFTLEHGTMDTSSLLNTDSVVSLDNLTVSPGQRLVVNKSWADTYVLPNIDGTNGLEDNKVFLGLPKGSATWNDIGLDQDFWAAHRWENQGANSTLMTSRHAGPSPIEFNITHASDTSSNNHFAIDFSREGHLSILRSTDANPSLTTEPVGGTFGASATWTDAYSTTGSGALDIVMAAKDGAQVALSTSGVSVITSPIPANQFDVTEDTSSLPLFNGDPAGDITLAAGSTYKFWLHSDSIESTDSLGICLISDNSDYTTGVTVVGTPGSFGSYLEFAVPADVPPVKFKWTSGGVAYYVTPGISGSTYSAGVTGITLEGPSANQTGTNVMDAGDHGWISLDETLSAGERLVLDNAFFTDFFGEVRGGSTVFAIGLKGANWTNTKVINGNGAAASGTFFAGNTYIVGQFSSGTGSSVTLWPVANGIVGNSMLLNTTALMNTFCAFIDIASSGDNIKIGFGRNGYLGITAGDESTVTYDNWNSSKGQSGTGYGSGITNLDVVMSFYTSNAGDIDGDEIDWTGLSEVSVPTAASSIVTPWVGALDFSGSNEYAQMAVNANWTQPLGMGHSSITVAAATAGQTSADTNSRPWATSIVFQTDGHSSNQHIWNHGEGASLSDDNIYVRTDSSRNLYFGWGREGVGYNECKIMPSGAASTWALSTSEWYGLYIAHTGERLSASNASAANLAAAFDIRLLSTTDSWAMSASNLSVAAQGNGSGWVSTGVRMNRSVTGVTTIGGRANNRSFHGKVAGAVITTMALGVAMPTDTFIEKMITDPLTWLADEKVGQNWRRPNKGYVDANFQLGSASNEFASCQVWAMGTGVSYPMVRNQVRIQDISYSKLNMVNMVSNDIETVNIPGLT